MKRLPPISTLTDTLFPYTGWFSWFADALHLAFTLMSLLWTVGMLVAPGVFSLPHQLFLIPVLGFFVAKAVFGVVLYRACVPSGWGDTLRAALASMRSEGRRVGQGCGRTCTYRLAP